jgi:tetratricopeptide (TPR) repeat protein
VYSDAAPETARSLAAGLDRLHVFFVRQVGLSPPPQRKVRVICFASPQEYAQYRTHPRADAYFLGTEDRDYIVMSASARGDLRVAAHEYAHVLIRSSGWKLPEWIAEGVSDVVSTVQLRDRESRIGGDLAERSAVLKNTPWLPLPELFAYRLDKSAHTSVFYAESWAIADLLMLSPAYTARFPSLLAALAAGVPAERALHDVYGASLFSIERDARARLARSSPGIPLPPVSADSTALRPEPLTPFAAHAVLADLRFANGELGLAESLYRALAAEHPADAEIHGALGTLALRRGDTGSAIAEWQRAIDLGTGDAALCFRYAALAGERGLPARAALERAIALRPDFDDARYQLALLEKNAGHAADAIAQLRAMGHVAPARAFAWWCALADSLLDLNRRAEAKQAAVEARSHALNRDESERAAQLEWMADTDLAVEIDGRNFRTVRVPAGTARNPFVEPGDRPQRVEATLREVECAGNGIRLFVDTAQGPLALAIPDPSRVEIRNAAVSAFEFTCGPQDAQKVLVEYAASSLVLRGLEMR